VRILSVNNLLNILCNFLLYFVRYVISNINEICMAPDLNEARAATALAADRQAIIQS
jgi:hypothetical protein